jgi:hypothetical protein
MLNESKGQPPRNASVPLAGRVNYQRLQAGRLRSLFSDLALLFHDYHFPAWQTQPKVFSPEIRYKHNVVVNLIHPLVDDESAIGRDRKAGRAYDVRPLLDCGESRHLVGGKIKKLN